MRTAHLDQLCRLIMSFVCLITSQCGFTAIMRAASNGHKDVVEILLRAGADLRLQDIVSLSSA